MSFETIPTPEGLTCFICYYCKENKDITELKNKTLRFVKKDETYKGKCTPCHTEYSVQYAIKKRSEDSPHLFMECDDCDRMFGIYKKGRPRIGGIKMKRTHCPYCESEEIYGLNEARKEIA